MAIFPGFNNVPGKAIKSPIIKKIQNEGVQKEEVQEKPERVEPSIVDASKAERVAVNRGLADFIIANNLNINLNTNKGNKKDLEVGGKKPDQIHDGAKSAVEISPKNKNDATTFVELKITDKSDKSDKTNTTDTTDKTNKTDKTDKTDETDETKANRSREPIELIVHDNTNLIFDLSDDDETQSDLPLPKPNSGSGISTEVETDEEISETEKNKKFADSYIEPMLSNLSKYKDGDYDAAQEFKEMISTTYKDFVNGKIVEDTFKENVDKSYKIILEENQDPNKVARLNHVVDEYKEKLSAYKDYYDGEDFASDVETFKNEYEDNNMTFQQAKNYIIVHYENVLEKINSYAKMVDSYKALFFDESQYQIFANKAKIMFNSEKKENELKEALNELFNSLNIDKNRERETKNILNTYKQSLAGNAQYNCFCNKAESIISAYIKHDIKTSDELKSKLDKLLDEVKELFEPKVTYDSNGNVISELINFHDDNGNLKYRNKINYNKDGSFTLFQYDPKTGASVKFEFDKNGECKKDADRGDYYLYKYDFTTGEVSIKRYQKSNGKESKSTNIVMQAGASLDPSISIKKMGYTLSISEIYDLITNGPSATTHIGGMAWTLPSMLNMFYGSMENTLNLLYGAQPGYRPSGSTTIYSYNSTNYADFIKNNLLDTVCKNYGYEPEDIKGYKFSTGSDLSATISKDPDLKAFVKSHLSQLKSGTGLPLSSSFESNGDLKYSIHGYNIIDSKSGKDEKGEYLILTLYDVYDFDPAYLDKAKNGNIGGMGDVLNAAGAAAMYDGKLVPYYMLIEVKVYI